MRIKYFETVNQDFSKSPGWFKLLLIMGLLYFIPIFGAIVINGYLYGWAREVALGARRPLPQRVFGNEDGRLYARGGRIFVIQLVYTIVPTLIVGCGAYALMGAAIHSATVSNGSAAVLVGIIFGYVAFLIILIPFMCALMLVVWAASIRAAVYDSLGAGFQLGAVFGMLKRDFGGMLRILGMYMLVALIVGMVAEALLLIVGLLMAFFWGMLVMGFVGGSGASQGTVGMLAIFGTLIVLLPCYYIVFVTTMYPMALHVRALGYWMRGVQPDLWQMPMDEPGAGVAPPPSG
jgi:hypothetical protein